MPPPPLRPRIIDKICRAGGWKPRELLELTTGTNGSNLIRRILPELQVKLRNQCIVKKLLGQGPSLYATLDSTYCIPILCFKAVHCANKPMRTSTIALASIGTIATGIVGTSPDSYPLRYSLLNSSLLNCHAQHTQSTSTIDDGPIPSSERLSSANRESRLARQRRRQRPMARGRRRR